MKTGKILSLILWLFVMCSWAAALYDTNFSFFPASGTEIKLYCQTPMYFMVNGWNNNYNAFSTSIEFDSSNIEITGWVFHPDFPSVIDYVTGNLYRVWWAFVWWSKQWTITWVSFYIKAINNISSANFAFVDFDWWDPVFQLDTTDDGISLNGVDVSSLDILESVTNTTYNFVALPCNADNKNPIITNVSVNNWATKISSGQIITFVTYDRDSNNPVSHWFAGNSTSSLSNYVSADSQHVDNQEWVNSWSIVVTVSCPTCSNWTLTGARLNISNWDWITNSMNALTWDSERRWYNVSIIPPFSYEVEKQVTVNISVSDNPNEFGQTHTGTHSFSFNNAVAPTITRTSPTTSTFVSPSKNYPISFYIYDAWAWVDTGSILITTTYSGEEFVYSWSDLNFTLSWWQPWLWNAWSYVVSFYPKEDFPENTAITLNITWSDLAGSTKTLQSSFTTRPDCSFFGCIDSVNIIWGGINQIFTWTVLSVTWTNPNSPYPYLTWEILMCGKDWSGTAIGGNIYLYDASWNRLNNVWYTWNELFITWLDVVHQDSVISIE